MRIKKGVILCAVLAVLVAIGSFMVFAAETPEIPTFDISGGQLIEIDLGGSEDWTPPPGWGLAALMSTDVIINGRQVEFYAYEIYGNNFFRLRDLAYALNGTEKQFDVTWNGSLGAVAITSGQSYTVIGGEMALGNSTGSFTPTPSNSRFMLDGEEITLTSYLINGNNFVRLRDVGAVLDFWVGFDGRVLVDTGYPYGARLFIGDDSWELGIRDNLIIIGD